MQIISHRGYWKTAAEKNGIVAFNRSFSLGFGTETDLRDYAGEIVISHDMADANSINCDELFTIFCQYNPHLPLALNVKADGLQSKLKGLVNKYGIDNYFVFDMSIPDTIGYLKQGLRFFSRQSEYEPVPAFYTDCAGVWLDAFEGTWYDADLIHAHINKGKEVAIVSPDLHKREVTGLWNLLKETGTHQLEGLILCTDIPEDAVTFFNA